MTRGDVLGEYLIKYFFNHIGEAVFALLLFVLFYHQIYCILTGKAIPYAIAGTDDEVAIVRDLFDGYLGEGSYDLVLRLHDSISLVFEISDGSAQRKHAIHTAVLNEAIGSLDSSLFAGEIRFVID